jgi:hypothetical protein
MKMTRDSQVTHGVRVRWASTALCGKPRLLALPLAIAAFLALAATPALAAKTHRLKTSFETPGEPNGVAVDEASANVFTAEGFPAPNCVVITGPEGGPPSGVIKDEICGFTTPPGGVAVDNAATSPAKGTLYVAEESGAVKRYVLEGGEYKPKGELSATPALGKVFGLATDAKGDLFVADNGGKAVVEFSPAGTQIARLDVSTIGSPASIAVDSAGDLIVQSATAAAYRFDANGSGEVEPGTEPEQMVEPGHAFGVAVDLGTDDLYVSNRDENNYHVNQLSATCAAEGEGKEEHCAPEGEFGRGILVSPFGVSVNSKTGFVYVVEPKTHPADPNLVAVFGPNVIVPAAVTGAASDVAGTSTTLNGTVDPSGSELDECKFEYGLTTEYGNTAQCAESPAEIGAGNAPVEVHANLTGLALGTKYHFRLVATSPTTVPNEKGPSVGADASFTTIGPQVHAESASHIGDTTARLEGLVNPVGQATTYLFQYVSEEDFEASEWAKALSAPPGGQVIGAGSEDVAVAQQIGGLAPATAYRFRIVATNHCNPDPEDECTVTGPAEAFTTYPEAPSGLPDSRAYEQVTPTDKNGSAPTWTHRTVQAALDGNAITYLSGGAVPGTEGAQQFPNYLASRGADWTTQGLLPAASSGSSAAVLGWSEDLGQAYDVQAALPGAPLSFLVRDRASHALRTIAAEGGTDITPAFNYVDATAEGSVVLFESDKKLFPGGANNAFNTYAWDRESGELSLVGVLPDGTVAKKGSTAGSNTIFGHRHYTQAQHTLSADGSRVFFSDPNTGQLYLRQNPTQPQSAIEAGACTEPELACTSQVSASQRAIPDPKGIKPATFWGASTDGSAALFTSPGKLTDDATTGPNDEGNDLYRYDVESGELLDLAPDEADSKGAEVQGVLGASEDGSYVYFAANGKLDTAPAPGNCSGSEGSASGTCNLYLWHEGDAVAFIAQLQLQVQGDNTNWLSLPESSTFVNKTARVSADGQTLLFRSVRRLGAYDNQGVAELYRYRAGDPGLTCISCNPTGAAPVGAVTLQSTRKSAETKPEPASILSRNLSANGNRVFFESPDKLVASDVNGEGGCEFFGKINGGSGPRSCQDVYEWEAKGTGSCESEAQNGGCLYLLSSGTSPAPSVFADADEEGDNAFLFTLDSLVKQDKDRILDIYDARVGGGIASQNPPPNPNPCPSAEACKGPVTTPPATESAGTSGFSGPGNPPACKKGKVRKRGRCAKRSQSHKRKHHMARRPRR